MADVGTTYGLKQSALQGRDWVSNAFTRLVGVRPRDLASYQGRIASIVAVARGAEEAVEANEDRTAIQIAVGRNCRALVERALAALDRLRPISSEADRDHFDELRATVRGQFKELDDELARGPSKDAAESILAGLLEPAESDGTLESLRLAGGFSPRFIDTPKEEEVVEDFLVAHYAARAIEYLLSLLDEQPDFGIHLYEAGRKLRCITALAPIIRDRFVTPDMPSDCLITGLSSLNPEENKKLVEFLEDLAVRSPRWEAEIQRGGRLGARVIRVPLERAGHELSVLLPDRTARGKAEKASAAKRKNSGPANRRPAYRAGEERDAELLDLLRRLQSEIEAAADHVAGLLDEAYGGRG